MKPSFQKFQSRESRNKLAELAARIWKDNPGLTYGEAAEQAHRELLPTYGPSLKRDTRHLQHGFTHPAPSGNSPENAQKQPAKAVYDARTFNDTLKAFKTAVAGFCESATAFKDSAEKVRQCFPTGKNL